MNNDGYFYKITGKKEKIYTEKESLQLHYIKLSLNIFPSNLHFL